MAKSKKNKKSERNNPLKIILSIIFFFVFAPKLVRIAWEMGYDYTNSKNGSGFYHLTKKDDYGYYKEKRRGAYTVGIIATFVMVCIVCALSYFIWQTSTTTKGIAASLFEIIPTGFVVIVICFMIVFLWAYLRGQMIGLHEKTIEVNEKLSRGIKIDEWGNEIKPKKSNSTNSIEEDDEEV